MIMAVRVESVDNSMSKWVFIKCRGSRGWTVVICVSFVDFVDGDGGDRGLSGWCSGC